MSRCLDPGAGAGEWACSCSWLPLAAAAECDAESSKQAGPSHLSSLSALWHSRQARVVRRRGPGLTSEERSSATYSFTCDSHFSSSRPHQHNLSSFLPRLSTVQPPFHHLPSLWRRPHPVVVIFWPEWTAHQRTNPVNRPRRLRCRFCRILCL